MPHGKTETKSLVGDISKVYIFEFMNNREEVTFLLSAYIVDGHTLAFLMRFYVSLRNGEKRRVCGTLVYQKIEGGIISQQFFAKYS